MTSHGSVSITSFDRLKMFPHPVTVKATALTDVGLGALSTCQLVAEVLPHAINTFTQIAFPDMGITFSHPRASGSGSFPLAVIYTGATKMPHFVIFEATFSKFSGN